ncbi:MAG TPA: hypothetical protein VGL65_00420 [Gemmatimonadales bacterium]|jgi:hypothetical protein
MRLQPPSHSYWLAGMIVGGVLGLIAGLQWQHGQCQDGCDDTTSKEIWVIPTMVFAVVGGMIGSGIHKNE